MTELNVSLYENTGGSYTEKFDVFFVKASDVTTVAAVASATKYNAISSASYTNTTYAQKSGSVTNSALAGQSVRVIVHCTSEADQYYLYIDDIVVTETVLQSGPYVMLNPTSATVLTGFSQTLTATYGNVTNPTITYTSSNTSVATVSGSGTTATVTAVAPGSATITATMTYQGNTYTATCAITVEDPSYCEPSFSNPSDDYISKFATSGGTTNINNTSTYVSSGYSDYYNNNSVSIEAGATLTCTVTSSSTQWSYGHAIWVDWNKDYEFTSEERVAYTSSTATGNWTGSFVVPANIAAGDYRMRVIHLYNNTPTDPCMSDSYGEAEDYKLTVIASGAYTITCATPTNGTLSADRNNADENDVITITATPETDYLLTALTFTPEGGSAQNISIASMPYTFTMPAANVTVNATFSLPACPKPTNVHAGNLTQHTAQITWNGNADSYTVRYRTATINGTTLDPVFEDGFESGLGSWTTYANDFQTSDFSAEYNITDWHQLSNASQDPHTGSYMAMSRSYDGDDRSVDNWLVTPQMTLGDVVKFWVAGDASWPEYYAVYVSTETNDVSDFVMIEAPSFPSVSDEWEERTVDISTYAGQTGYVAIRHTDTGKDYLLIDDFGVYNTINTYSYGTDNTITPATSPCNITGLDAETLYEVSVQADCGGDGTSGWSPIYFTTPDACAAPTDLVSSNITSTTATLGWADNQESYNLRYRKVYFYEGFEGETLPTGWTTIDANDDGNTWSVGHATTHSGSNGAYNLSYIYNVYGTTPDDWLISPQLDLQGTLRVWLSGYGSDNAEHFAIYLSTTGNSVSDFTTTLVGETTTSNAYVEYTADLSSYAGQQGYIAIHHFNCEDQRYLYVDDFGIYGSENWVSVSPNPTDATASLSGLSAGTDYEWQVQGISCNNNGDNTSWSATSNFTTLYPTKIRNTSPAADEMTWLQFAKFVSKGHSYSDETVTLMENISASDMVGTNSHSFCGTFDGDGKTITANISSSEQGAAPFRYISGATIQNLVVAGTVTSTAHHASGLVGFCADGSTNTIQNCLVNTNVTNSNAYNGDSGNNYMGGIIGHNMTATTSIIGCVYDGTLTSQGFKGGIIGFAGNNSTINLTNSYFGGGYSANGYTDPNFSPIGVKSSGRTENINFSNFYYNTEAGTFTASGYNIMNGTNNVTGSPKLSYTVTGATDVTVAMRGDYTHYDVSDIYGYGTGIVYNGTIIGGNADNLSLNLGYTGTGSCSGYVADYGDLSGSAYSRENDPYTLTMPNSNVEISVKPGTVSVDGSAVCSGRASTLTATTVGFNNPQFTWTASSSDAGLVSQNAGEISVTPTAGGTYTYTCSVTEGNDATVISDNIELTMKQSPTASIDGTNPLPVCVFTQVTLNASGAGDDGSYTWDNELGSGASKTITVTEAKNYTVTVTDANTCTARATKSVTLKIPGNLPSTYSPEPGIIWTGYESTDWDDQRNWLFFNGDNYTPIVEDLDSTLSVVLRTGGTEQCILHDPVINNPEFDANAGMTVRRNITIANGTELNIGGALTLEGGTLTLGGSTYLAVGDTVLIADGATVSFSASDTLVVSGNFTLSGNINFVDQGMTDNEESVDDPTDALVIGGDFTINGARTFSPAGGSIVFARNSGNRRVRNNTGRPLEFFKVELDDERTRSGVPHTVFPDGTIIKYTAIFSYGIWDGDLIFAKTGNALVKGGFESYASGNITKIGKNKSFSFPTGGNDVLGSIAAKIPTDVQVSAKFNSKTGGYDQEHDGYPRWWNNNDMCDDSKDLNHVSNYEYWTVRANTTTTLTDLTFTAEAADRSSHFNPASSEDEAVNEEAIRLAMYNGCWKNLGGADNVIVDDGKIEIEIPALSLVASGAKGIADDPIITLGSTTKTTILPIELTSFTATCDGRSSLIEWTTATERNNDYFSLERSDDAINFTEIARVAGAGNSIEPLDYSYTDYVIHGGNNYYRLVQVDYDGTRTVSEVIVANCIEPEYDGEPEVMAYPNPFNGELTLVLDNFSNRAATIEVYDMLGKLIYTEKASAPQNSYETILNLSNLPSGAYTVRVSTTDFVINKNVVKN